LVSILVSWVYILTLCSTYGWLLIAGVRHFTQAKSENVPLSVVPLLGLTIISMLTTYLAFLGGIGVEANLVILSVALLFGWIKREPLFVEIKRSLTPLKQLNSFYLVLLVLLAAVLAFKSSVGRNLLHFDTGYYHAQSIEWIIQYGIVPGLGNLHTPLAYDSLWFQPCALFSFTFLLHQPLHGLLGLVVFIGFCFALAGLRETLIPQNNLKLSSVVQALLLIPLTELASNISSPSTDEPTSVFILVLFVLFCRYGEQKGADQSIDILQFNIALLAIFATLLKLSALPVLLFLPYMVYQSVRQRKTWLASTCTLLLPLLWLPKLIRTVILSGYLIYPYPNIDLFSFDWKMPLAVVQDQKRYIESWGRSPFADPKEVLSHGFWGWFPGWLANFSKGYAALWLLIACVSIFVFFALQVFSGSISRFTLKLNFERYAIVYGIGFISVTYWFLISPLIRYGFGLFWAFLVLLLAPLSYRLSKLASKLLQHNATGEKVFIVVVSILVWFVLRSDCPLRALGTGIRLSRFYTTDIRSLIWQERYPFVPTVSGVMGGFSIYRPLQGEQCWDHPLPCTPYLYTAIEGRGPSIKDGFRPATGSIGIFDAKRILIERGKR
jgi:hypothetical protein